MIRMASKNTAATAIVATRHRRRLESSPRRYKIDEMTNRRVEELLEHLTEPQREAVTHVHGPLLVVAGPGSGKTRVITHRAAYLARTVTRPWNILAITFTNKAANEMSLRMARLGVGGDSGGSESMGGWNARGGSTGRGRNVGGVTCSTFHAFCARMLRIHGERVGLANHFSIFDDADQTAAIKLAIEMAGGTKVEQFTPGNLLNAISKAKNDMVTAAAYAEQARDWNERIIAPIYEAYEKILLDQNAVDFDDLLLKTARLLGDHEDLRDQLEQRYQFVLVDEYQDTNKAQYLIARGLCLRNENLCVTGDPDQSIYGWRGANIHNILQFEEDFPNAKVVRLEQNYRSTPQILSAADAVIQHNEKRKVKKLWTDNENGPEVRVAECEDANAEAAFIASEIRNLVQAGGTYGQVAIFYRANYLSRVLEIAMRNAHVPYQIARGVAFFQRKEIKDTLAYLRLVANPQDQVALQRIINVPARGIGDVTVERLLHHAQQTGQPALSLLQQPEQIAGIAGITARASAALKEFARLIGEIRSAIEAGQLQEALEQTVQQTGLIAMWSKTQDDEAIENVNELISFAAEFDRQHSITDAEAPPSPGLQKLTDWLQQISLVADQDAIDAELGAVTLMTLHAAKGLEFDTVFIAGLEEGLLPHERSKKEGDIEEERRLFFVGMTRARRALTITRARWRDFRGMTQRTSQSVFLTELPREGVVRVDVGEDGTLCYDSEAKGQGQGRGRGRSSVASDEDDVDNRFDPQHWQPGRFVRHKQYGIGRLLWARSQGKQTYVGVQFAAYGEKTFRLDLAPLEPVDMDDLY